MRVEDQKVRAREAFDPVQSLPHIKSNCSPDDTHPPPSPQHHQLLSPWKTDLTLPVIPSAQPNDDLPARNIVRGTNRITLNGTVAAGCNCRESESPPHLSAFKCTPPPRLSPPM